MKTLLIFIIVLFSIQLSYSQNNIDPKIKKYVDEWKAVMQSVGIEYGNVFDRIDNIYFKNNSDNRLGYSTYAKREVWVSSKVCDMPYLIRASLYHELGHYIFQLDHSDGIMSANKLGDNEFYKKNWSSLLSSYLLKCKD